MAEAAPESESAPDAEEPSGVEGPEEPAESDETREAVVGSEIEIVLEGNGWIYLGEEEGRDGLSFRRRYDRDGDTVFLFDVLSPGTYTARFQRQDLEQGQFREHRLALDAVPEDEADEAGDTAGADEAGETADADEAGDAEGEEEPVQAADAENLVAGAASEAAPEAAPEAEELPGGEEYADLLEEELDEDAGDGAEAESGAADSDGAAESPSHLERFRAALADTDAEAAFEHYVALKEEQAAAERISAEELLELGRLLLESDDQGRALEPLEEYRAAAEEPDDEAELYFNLGRAAEARRDAAEAVDYYAQVVEGFPLSRHWEPAEERINYLRRHFLEVR